MKKSPAVSLNFVDYFRISFTVEVGKTVLDFDGIYENLPEFFGQFDYENSIEICKKLQEILYKQGKVYCGNLVNSVATHLPIVWETYRGRNKGTPTP
jgi:hypothetical protein